MTARSSRPNCTGWRRRASNWPTCARLPPEGAELGEIGGTAIELMRRPYINYELVAKVIGRGEGVTTAMAQRIETEIRYAGYIAREERIIRDIQRHENVKIP